MDLVAPEVQETWRAFRALVHDGVVGVVRVQHLVEVPLDEIQVLVSQRAARVVHQLVLFSVDGAIGEGVVAEKLHHSEPRVELVLRRWL